MRRSTSDTIEFLAEKSEKERELKNQELAIKKRELDLAETRHYEKRLRSINRPCSQR